MTLYAAYGPNMDPHLMSQRCPHSPLQGTGWLLGWRLTFGGEEFGWDGALATIVEDPLEQVFVALYDITDEDTAALDELQSISTMEALASGLPVVAADAMALPHLVHPGVNGYLYQPGDIEAFAGYLRTILTAAPDELDRLRRGALRTVEAHDIQRTLDIFEALYRGEEVVDPDTEGELAR